MKFILNIVIVFLLIITVGIVKAKADIVTYTLQISETTKIINGKEVKRYLINNSANAPVIKANMGDVLEVKVENNTSISTMIHWHGVLVPNNMDGTHVTQAPIESQSSFTYKFEVKQTGTYWYHAHGLEEAEGIYGGIIFNNKEIQVEEGTVLLFSGESDKTPTALLASLQNGQMMGSDHSSMMNMDHSNMDMTNNHYSDVTFANSLVNGSEGVVRIVDVENNRVKLRIINAYADGFLNFVYSGGKIKILSADGLDVQPITVTNLKVAMGETYDIELLVPNPTKSYELIGFVLGTEKHSQIIINQGELVALSSYNSKEYVDKSYYKNLNTISPSFLNFDNAQSIIDYDFTLAGGQNDYSWFVKYASGKNIDTLNILAGTKVRMKITNSTDMPHPMHLHGFFFKVIDESQNSLIKHTYNLDAKQSVTFEFIVDAEGKWLLHCHNLFHMASGMMITLDVKE